MADDLEKAILISFAYNIAADPQLKEQASAYLSSFKQSSDCWKVCIERYSSSSYHEVKFWCLQTLQEVLRACYQQLDGAAQGAIKAALLGWLQRDCAADTSSPPGFLRNKLAQALVVLVQLQYPAAWPTFFHDMVAAAATGPGLADMFVRILASVDEDIISLEFARSNEAAKLSMDVKDAMREGGCQEVAEACYSLAQLYGSSRPELAAGVLSAFSRYIHWIDIGLVANDRFIPMLLAHVNSPNLQLRGAATDCLVEVVSKRMEPTAKVQLVQELRIAAAIAAWTASVAAAAAAVSGGPPGALAALAAASSSSGGSAGVHVPPEQAAAAAAMLEDEEILGKYATLLATTAGEVMDALKRIENSLISFAAMGFAINDEASQEANAAAEAALQLLDVLTPAIIQAFCSGVLVVAMPLVPFINTYVQRLKALSKRSQALPANVGGHLQAILVGVVVNSVYPPDSFNDAAAADNMLGEESAAREEQQEVEERRKELFVLLKNVAKLGFSEALRFTGQLLQLVLEGSGGGSGAGGSNAASSSAAAGMGAPAANGTPIKAAAANGTSGVRWQDVEVAVTCVYELGEGAPEEALKPGSGDLGQLALLLMSRGAQLPCGQHRLVALATLEVTVRYCRVLQQQQSAIPPVLSLFVGWCGLGHPSPDVCARACYLFARLVKQLRSNLRQYVPEILQSVEPHLRTVVTCPPTSSSGLGGGSAGGSGASPGGLVGASGVRDPSGKVLMPSTSMIDDRLYLYEAVSLLLGLEEINAEQQQAALSSLLQILMQQLEVNLQRAVAEAAAAGDGGRSLPLLLPGGQPGAIWLVLQAVEALTRLNKGFKTDLVTKSRPHLGALFMRSFEVVLAAPKALPNHKQLRARCIAFLHRLVECLLGGLLPYLPAALASLLHGPIDVGDMTEVLALLVQLLMRFKKDLRGLMEGLLPSLVPQLHQLLGQDWDWSGASAAPVAAQQQQQQQQQLLPDRPSGVSATLEFAREKGELQRGYYSVLHALAHHGLAPLLLSCSGTVGELMLGALTRGAATHVDPGVRKLCLQVLQRLLEAAAATPQSQLGWEQFAIEQVGGEACCRALVRPGARPLGATSGGARGSNGSLAGGSPGLDPRDAATVAYLAEVASCCKLVYAQAGERFVAHLAAQVLPTSGLPGEAQQQLLYHVREGDAKALRDCMRNILVVMHGMAAGRK